MGHTEHAGDLPDLPGTWRGGSQEDISVLGLHLIGSTFCRDRTGDRSARGTHVARGTDDLDGRILFTGGAICITLRPG